MASASGAGDDDDNYEWKKKLPVGVRFQPSDEELVVFYLKAKVDKADIRPGIIKEINLYEYEPWQLKDLAYDHGDGRMYFFTKLHKKYENGMRTKRDTTQGGHWKATQAREDLKSKNGEIVGTKTPLAYYVINKETGNPVKTQWLMNEFRMPKQDTASQKTEVPPKSEEWALCVVHYHNKDANGSNSDDGQSLIPERVEEDHPSPCTKRTRTTGVVVIRDPMPSTSLNPPNPNPCNVTSPEHNHSQKTQNPNSYSKLSLSTATFNSTLGIDPIPGQNLHHFPTPNLHSSNLSQISNINPPRQQYHHPPQQAILQNHVYSFGPSPSIKRRRVNGVAIQDPMPSTSSNPNPCNATIQTMHIIEHYHSPNPNSSANLGPSTVTLNSTLGVDPILSQNRHHFLRTNLQSSNPSQISQIDRGLSHTPVQTTYQAISSSSSITNRDNNLGLNLMLDHATSVPQRVTSFDLLIPNPRAMLRPILDMIQIPNASLDTSTTSEHQPNQCTLHGNGDESDDGVIR